MGTEQQALTAYLAAFTTQWARPQAWDWNPYNGPSSSRNAEQVAADLLADAEFRALRLGTWLSTPEGEFVAAAVTSLMPQLYAADADVLIRALQLAARSSKPTPARRSQPVSPSPRSVLWPSAHRASKAAAWAPGQRSRWHAATATGMPVPRPR